MVLDQLVTDGKLMRNVVHYVDRIPGDAQKFSTYTAEQVDKILVAIADDRNRHAWYLALSALRRGEIGGLDWNEDIDFATEEIQVGRRTRVSAGGRVIEKPAKTEAGQRTLPLWEPLLGELKAAKARQAAEKLRMGPAYHDLGYVMCNEAGEPCHPDDHLRHVGRGHQKGWGSAHPAARCTPHVGHPDAHAGRGSSNRLGLAGSRRRGVHDEDVRAPPGRRAEEGRRAGRDHGLR